MRMDNHKGYCPSCRKLVRVRAEIKGRETEILCTQCGRQMYINDGFKWRPAGPKVSSKIQ